MIKIFVLIMVVSGGDWTGTRPPVAIKAEFSTLEKCQTAMKSISSQVPSVHSSGCYEK